MSNQIDFPGADGTTTKEISDAIGSRKLAHIEWIEINDATKGQHLHGDSLSIYRSAKGYGITFSQDFTKVLRDQGWNHLRVGTTVTGHIILQFGDEGTGISIMGINARVTTKAAHEIFCKLLGLQNEPAKFRKVYKLSQASGGTGMYFINGEAE